MNQSKYMRGMNFRIIFLLASLVYNVTSTTYEGKREITESLLKKLMTHDNFQKGLLSMIDVYMLQKAREVIPKRKIVYRICLPIYRAGSSIWECTVCTRTEAKFRFPFIFKNTANRPRFYKIDLI